MSVLELDPNVVQPGWTPLIITVGLGLAVVLLYLSMRKQFRNISVPHAETEPPEPAVDEPSTPAPVERSTPAPVEPSTGSST